MCVCVQAVRACGVRALQHACTSAALKGAHAHRHTHGHPHVPCTRCALPHPPPPPAPATPQLRPLEEIFKFGHFFSPLMMESDFEAKPSVLLLGQYSAGAHVCAHACSWCA